MEDLMQFLREEGISEDVLHEVHEYVFSHPVSDAMKREKMFCVKILPMYFKDQAGIFLSM